MHTSHRPVRRGALRSLAAVGTVAGLAILAAAPAQAARGYPVNDRIYVSDSVYGVAVDNSLRQAYVANESENTVSVVDLGDNTVRQVVPVGVSPRSIAVARDSHEVVVADSGSSQVTLLNVVNGDLSVRTTVAVGNDPVSVALDARMHRAYVVNAIDNTMSVVDVIRAKVIATVPLARDSDEVVVSPATHMVLVTDPSKNTLTEIDGSTYRTIATVPTGNDPGGVAVNHSGTRAYVSNLGEPLQIIDTATASVIGAVDVPDANAGDLALDPDGKQLYALTGDHLYAIDLHHRRVVGSTRFEHIPIGVAFDRTGGQALITAGYHLNVVSPR